MDDSTTGVAEDSKVDENTTGVEAVSIADDRITGAVEAANASVDDHNDSVVADGSGIDVVSVGITADDKIEVSVGTISLVLGTTAITELEEDKVVVLGKLDVIIGAVVGVSLVKSVRVSGNTTE